MSNLAAINDPKVVEYIEKDYSLLKMADACTKPMFMLKEDHEYFSPDTADCGYCVLDSHTQLMVGSLI